MVEQATSLESAFIAKLTRDIVVSDVGMELKSWKIVKKDRSVVQLIDHGFSISKQSRFSVYLHCKPLRNTQKNVEFQIYSLTDSKPVITKTVSLTENETTSVLLHYRIDGLTDLSIRIFGKELDFEINQDSRVEVTETHRWEEPELIVGNVNYPWKSLQEIKIGNDMSDYSLLYINAKKGDRYLCKTLTPFGMRHPSKMHKLNDPWEIDLDNLLTLRFVGYYHKRVLNIKETNRYEIISMYGVRC